MWLALSCIRAVAGTCFPPLPDQGSRCPCSMRISFLFPGGSCRFQVEAGQVLMSLAMVSAACWAVPPWQCLGGCTSACHGMALSEPVINCDNKTNPAEGLWS